MPYYQMMDPLYWMIIGPTMLLAMWAQYRVSSAYARWSREPNSSGITGAQAAQTVLDHAGIGHLQIEEHPGQLSDHYDPSKKVLRLSPGVFHGRSVASIAVATHEAGHAVQDATGYAGLAVRSLIVPMASFGSYLAMPLILFGLLLNLANLVLVGIVAFGVIVLFQLVNLPVELDASSRAKRLLAETGIVRTERETRGVSSMLTAAAMTYVAATVTAAAQLLYYVLLFSGRSRDRA